MLKYKLLSECYCEKQIRRLPQEFTEQLYRENYVHSIDNILTHSKKTGSYFCVDPVPMKPVDAHKMENIRKLSLSI